MIAHTGLNVTNYKRSKKFYAQSLKPLGYSVRMDLPKWKAAGFSDGKNLDFWIGEKKRVTPIHVAFEAKSKKVVDAWYKAALKAGGRDNGAPGYRADYWAGYYAAFAYDFDGNNIEAVYWDYKKTVEKKPRS